MTETVVARERWFFGPLPDLLLGCGVLYFALFAAQAAVGPALRASLPITLLPVLTLALGAPHYGATLLRAYGARESRHRYFVFGVYATLFLAAVYLVGLRVVWVGSLLVTVYLTWSPWHYSGQNYGVAVLFLMRRGIRLDALARRLLYGCFALSYLMVFLAIHSTTSSPDYAPDSYRGTHFDFLSLGIPMAIYAPVSVAVDLGWLACVMGFLWVMLPRAPLRDLVPSALLIAAQALWFALPTAAIQWGLWQGVEPLRHEFRPYAFMWVAVGHFVQYLWITTYYAAGSEGSVGRLRYLGQTLLAGSAVWVAPTLLLAPTLLGGLRFETGLALLTAAAVNIHHFVLDGVIWKQRDGWLPRHLLRRAEDLPPPIRPRRLAWAGWSIWILGAFCLIVSLGLKADLMFAQAAFERGDSKRLRATYDRRAWFGRDNSEVRLQLARDALRDRDLAGAREELRRAAALGTSAAALVLEAGLEELEGRPQRALELYDAALRLEPSHARARQRSAALRSQAPTPNP